LILTIDPRVYIVVPFRHERSRCEPICENDVPEGRFIPLDAAEARSEPPRGYFTEHISPSSVDSVYHRE